MKILVQYKNGVQIVGDIAAMISPLPPSEIDESVELAEEEYEELVLTKDSQKTNLKELK